MSHISPKTKPETTFIIFCVQKHVRSAHDAILGKLRTDYMQILFDRVYMWLEWHLLTVTLFARPEGVTVSGDICRDFQITTARTYRL